MASRAKTLPYFPIGNKVADLDRNKLHKIGTSPKDAERRAIKDRCEDVDRPRVKTDIAAVGPADVKTSEGGCRFLRRWYREKFWNYPTTCPGDWLLSPSLVGTYPMSLPTPPSLPFCVAIKSAHFTVVIFVCAKNWVPSGSFGAL